VPNVIPSGDGESTSRSLLDRVRAREASAWERLVALYTPLVDRWLRSGGLQNADIDDLTQEVFLAVSHKIGDFHHDQDGDTFRGWLHRITQNKVRDRSRKLRDDPLAGRAGAQEQLEHLAARMDESSEQALAEEKRVLCRSALQLIERDFQPTTWRAFWRMAIDGQKARTVADELGISLNAVYLAQGRVLARLREEFGDVIKGPGPKQGTD
jgi:RNA polymerase sigma-70 factor (ECF subfamily)